MQSKPVLEASDVAAMLAAAEAHAIRQGWAVTIAICDDGGHLLALKRLDRASPSSAAMAPAKANSAALMRRETKIAEDMINQGRFAFLSAPRLDGMLEGGVPILVDGSCVGAIGVSGVQSAQDAEIARAGIQALG